MTIAKLKKATKKELVRYVADLHSGVNYGVYSAMPVDLLRRQALHEFEMAQNRHAVTEES